MCIISLVGGIRTKVCFFWGCYMHTHMHTNTLVILNIKKRHYSHRHRQTPMTNFTWRKLIWSPLSSWWGDDVHNPPGCRLRANSQWLHYRSWTEWTTLDLHQKSVFSSKPHLWGHAVLSWPITTSSLPKTASGIPPSPWNSSSISCSPAVPARDAHRAAPSLRPSVRSSRA